MTVPDIYLQLNVDQVADLIKRLPEKQKKQIVDLLLEGDISVTEDQKQLVRNRIKKYKNRQDKLISERNAWKLIDSGK
ncbi:MAG: hypothetical protein SFU87_20275 [Chitinophagaceae bacterium]|nr:hypothetical protein [Chitinophagaceae bacterium]